MKLDLKAIFRVATLAVTSIFALSTASFATPIQVVNDPGFETSTSNGSMTSWPLGTIGTWGVGDPVGIVGAENGINPLTGLQMLRFSGTGGSAQDIYQIIDITAFATEIDAGLVTADIAAFFNSTGPEPVGLRLGGFTFAPTSFSGFNLLGGGYLNSPIDGNPQSWEQVSYSGISITAGIRYLAVGIHAPTGGAINYADDVTVQLFIEGQQIPVPAPLLMIGIGLFGLSRLRQRS